MFFNSYTTYTEKNTTENKIAVAELKQCEQYDISMTANIGAVKFSDEAVIDPISTPPSVQAGDKINPDVTPTAHGVDIQWDWSNTLPCVTEYQIQLCLEDEYCQEPSKVVVDNSNFFVEYKSLENLDVCTKYSAIIKPIYQDKNIREKHLKFQTLSPLMNNVSSQLEPFSTTSGSDHKVTIRWSVIKCADDYRIYQKLASESEEETWEFVESSKVETEIVINGFPCSKYKFGVGVIIDGVKSDIVEVVETVVTTLDAYLIMFFIVCVLLCFVCMICTCMQRRNGFLPCRVCQVWNTACGCFHIIPCFTMQTNTKSTSWAWMEWTVPATDTPGLVDLVNVPHLTHQLTDYILHNAVKVPAIIVRCIGEINRRDLASEIGIYRLCGNKRNVIDLREKLLVGRGPPNISQYNVHTLTGVVKHFLISLEE